MSCPGGVRPAASRYRNNRSYCPLGHSGSDKATYCTCNDLKCVLLNICTFACGWVFLLLTLAALCDVLVRTCSEWEMSPSPAGFMTYVVEPLFVEWSRFSDTRLSQTMMGHLSLNKQGWKEGRDKQEASTSMASEEQRTSAAKDSNSKELPQGSKRSWLAKRVKRQEAKKISTPDKNYITHHSLHHSTSATCSPSRLTTVFVFHII